MNESNKKSPENVSHELNKKLARNMKNLRQKFMTQHIVPSDDQENLPND